MDVEDLLPPARDELLRQQSQVARQADPLGAGLLERRSHPLLVRSPAGLGTVSNQGGRQSQLARPRQTGCVFDVGEYQRDARGYLAALDRGMNRQEITAAS